jgi:hypothetical protein
MYSSMLARPEATAESMNARRLGLVAGFSKQTV